MADPDRRDEAPLSGWHTPASGQPGAPGRSGVIVAFVAVIGIAVIGLIYTMSGGSIGTRAAPTPTPPPTADVMSWNEWHALSQVTVKELNRLSAQDANPVRAEAILAVVKDEQDSMQGVEPDPCFRPAFTAYLSYLSSLRSAMENVIAGDLDQATQDTTRSSSFAKALGDELYRADLACS